MTKRHHPAGRRSRRTASGGRSRQTAPHRDKAGRPRQYCFAAESLIGEVAQLKRALTPLLSAATVVTLDASALQRIDGATLQLLCAFLRERRSRGQVTEWRGVPAVLHQAAGLLGLASELGLPQQDGA